MNKPIPQDQPLWEVKYREGMTALLEALELLKETMGEYHQSWKKGLKDSIEIDKWRKGGKR